MAPDPDDLLAGPYALGQSRTIDLETLLAVTSIVGHLGVVNHTMNLSETQVRLLSSALSTAVHDAELETLLDHWRAPEDELRADLDARLTALVGRLRAAIHQGDQG